MVSYLQIFPDQPVKLPPDLGHFKCLILTAQGLPDDGRNTICSWTIDAGCRWAMTWGPDCELWHDCIDDWVLLRHNHSVPDDKFVLTTWHEHESLEEVMLFAKHAAIESYDDLPLTELLVLDLGDENRMELILRIYQQ